MIEKQRQIRRDRETETETESETETALRKWGRPERTDAVKADKARD